MKIKNKFYAGVLLRLLSSFILLTSLLVLPKAQAAVDDIFTIGELRYTVLTEEPATQTGTVSVQKESTKISSDIEIPASVVYGEINYPVVLIPNSAFRARSKLTSIVIPDSITSIGTQAFEGCSSLKSIIIPGSVNAIGNFAYSYCNKLTAVYFKGNAPEYPGGFEFNYTAIIYYKPGTTGWKKTLNDRPTKEWIE